MAYDLGQLVRCTIRFTDANDLPADPTAVTFRFRTPTNVVTTYTYGTNAQLVKDTVGGYHVDLDANLPGTWWYRFAGTGAIQAADETYFNVEPTRT